jgi:hypothetical protein
MPAGNLLTSPMCRSAPISAPVLYGLTQLLVPEGGQLPATYLPSLSKSQRCRDLTWATYILCTEHPIPVRLSRESNPGPSALQANILCEEPFEWRC